MRKQRNYYNEEIGIEEYKGMLTTEKSITIPGQDMTPTELITRFTSAPRPEHTYINDMNADSYSKMDTIEKLQFMRDLQTRTQVHTDSIRSRIAELEKEQEIKDRLSKINKETQTTTTNDDDKVS